jgi:hypothetical protein
LLSNPKCLKDEDGNILFPDEPEFYSLRKLLNIEMEL